MMSTQLMGGGAFWMKEQGEAGDRTAGLLGQDSVDFILSAEGSHRKVSDNGVT